METRQHQPAVLLLHIATTPGYPPPAQHSFEENPTADEQIRAALNEPLRRTMKPAGGINSSFQRKSEQATPNPSPGARAAAPAGQWVHLVLVTSGES